jgi:viroplasmin and RNaseH domain-containing protein
MDPTTDAAANNRDRAQEKEKWYVVFSPLEGRTYGVYQGWSEASQHYNGVPGATIKVFENVELAVAYASGQSIPAHKDKSNQQDAGRAQSSTSGGRGLDVDENHGQGLEELRPPEVLLGSDPSRSDEEMFEIDVGLGENDLRESLCPPGLTDNSARRMVAEMVDVVALPGMFTGGGDVGDSESSYIGEGLAELVNQQASAGGGIRSDLQWRSEKRTSLLAIKSMDMLIERKDTLWGLRDQVLKRMTQATKTACRQSGWTNKGLINSWATGGFLPVMIRRSFYAYVNLHMALYNQGTASGSSFKYIETYLQHHGSELRLIRNCAESRLHAMCRIYIYLRDNCKKKWLTERIQMKKNLELLGGSGAGSTNACLHCYTILHLGGTEACPWKSDTDTEARAKGRRALSKLGKPYQQRTRTAADRDSPASRDE